MTTVAEDEIDPFTPRIEELLREREAAHGVGRPVVVLICDLFIYLMRLMAAIAERKRAGEVVATVVAGALDEPEIDQPVAEAAREMPPCVVAGVKRPVGLLLPRRARGRKLKVLAAAAPARRRHADDRGWPLWRGVSVLWTAEVGFLRVDLMKWVWGSGDTCAYFVAI